MRKTLAALVLLAASSAAQGAGQDTASAPEPAPGRSAASDTTPRILILGSPHISGDRWEVSEDEAGRIVRALRSYRPDMVVVEYLPPNWEQGHGRDYRPDFEYAAYARKWDLPAESGTSGACHEAKLYFLERDLMNAAYRWLDAECAAEADSAIGAWLEDYAGHEAARIAFPVARASGVERIVSFDYQGEDARWFLQEAIEEARNEGGRAGAEADSLMARMKEFRTWADSATSGSFASVLRMANSPRWMEMQERVYEVLLPSFEFEHAGRHQTIHYWIRNREMFERIEEAVAAQRPDRILVVVGMGHKYFLDALARERGYRWVDPRDYLPGASPE